MESACSPLVVLPDGGRAHGPGHLVAPLAKAWGADSQRTFWKDWITDSPPPTPAPTTLCF